MMRIIVASLLAGVFVCSPACAYAQQSTTVGEILDKGGKKLSKEQTQALYAGATVSGTQAGRPETTFQNKYMPDGTVVGDAWRNGVFSGKVSGTWSMNESGQFCNQLNGGTVKGCFYVFNLNNRFYAAFTDARSDPVYERQFAR